MKNPSLLILPGDGIGQEVMAEVRKVIQWFGENRDLNFDVSEDLVGGAAYDQHGTPLHDETMAKAQEVDAVLLGAVGGPKYDDLDFSVKPERGLLRLRKEMDLFSNLRPAQCFDALADFSSLKKELVSGLDIMIVRELTSGSYFGEPRGIFTEDNQRVGINTQRYTESEIDRVARSAFELARRRNNKVCSMEKANVMESEGEVAPRIKRKQTLAETAIIVLSKASRPIHYMEVRQRVRDFPYPHADKNLGPALKKLLKKGVIKMKKSSGKHLYSIAKRAA